MSLTNLIIRHKDLDLDKLDFHLEQFNKSFTTKSFKMKKQTKLYTYEQHQVLDCENYEKFSEGKCDSRLNCIDICYNEKFLNNFHGLPRRNSLIYSDAYPKGHKQVLSLYVEDKKDEELWKNCSEEFKKQDCDLINFLHVFEENKVDRSKNELVIDPFFFQIKQGFRLNFNLFQMICSLITLSTILTGFNWPRASNTTIQLLNYFLKEDDRLNLKHVFFLISFLGFFVHAYYIFGQTCLADWEINSRNDFDFGKANTKIPELVLCVKHNLSLSEEGFKEFKKNEEPTGALLDEKTHWLNESYLFREIIFFDTDMEKKAWSPPAEKPENLQIYRWFMHDFTCFTLRYHMNPGSIKNYVINTILKLNFNPELAKQNRTFIFSSKNTGTNDFSHYYLLNFNAVNRVEYAFYHTMQYNQFQSLVNPRLLFHSGHKINVSHLSFE